MSRRTKGSLIFNLFLIIVFAGAIFVAMGYNHRARIAPLVIAIPGLLVTLILLALELKKQAKLVSNPALAASGQAGEAVSAQVAGQENPGPGRKFLGAELNPFFWLTALLAMLFVVGFAVAIPVYLFLFLRVRSQEKTLFSVIFSLVAWAGLYVFFDRLLHIPLYQGVVAEYFF